MPYTMVRMNADCVHWTAQRNLSKIVELVQKMSIALIDGWEDISGTL